MYQKIKWEIIGKPLNSWVVFLFLKFLCYIFNGNY